MKQSILGERVELNLLVLQVGAFHGKAEKLEASLLLHRKQIKRESFVNHCANRLVFHSGIVLLLEFER
jgi:hypothetical protein